MTEANPGGVALRAHALTKRFGARVALDGLDLEVAPATRHAVLGPNGSGKSTLFRIAATLLVPDSGSFSVAGVDALAHPEHARRSLGVVFQKPSLDGKLTALENLAYAGRLNGLERAAARRRGIELLERFGVADRADDRVESLSGGTQRRVEIAKALVHEPKSLLLDEPSTGLDPTARERLTALFADLKDLGVTVCFTTHLFDEAEAADRVTILDRGRVVANGSPRELADGLGGTILRLRAQDSASARESLERIVGGAARRLGDSWVATCDDPATAAATLARELDSRLDHLEIARPSLADVFARATGRDFGAAGENDSQARSPRR